MRLIDADKLCESIMKVWDFAEENGQKKLANAIADVLVPAIVSQPTVEAEPIINAKWVDAPNPPAHKDSYKCSKCYTGAIHDMNGYSVLTRYCSYCGAKMNKHHNRMGEVEEDL